MLCNFPSKNGNIPPINQSPMSKVPKVDYKILLLGEGNFTYSYALIGQNSHLVNFFLPTEVKKKEIEEDPTEEDARKCMKRLKEDFGVTCQLGVDATSLSTSDLSQQFQFPVIHFNSPHTGFGDSNKMLESFFKEVSKVQKDGDILSMILVTDDRYWNTIYQMNKIFQYGYVHANLQDINKYVQKGYRHKMTQKDQSFQKLYLQHVFVRQCREKRDDVVPSALLEYMQTFLPAWKNSPLCDLLLAGDSTDLCRRAALSTVRKMLENLDAQGNLLEITNNNIRWILKGYEHKKEKCQPVKGDGSSNR
jgi:hypothetical protein